MQIQKTGFSKAATPRPNAFTPKTDVSSPEYYQDGYSEGARWTDPESGNPLYCKFDIEQPRQATYTKLVDNTERPLTKGQRVKAGLKGAWNGFCESQGPFGLVVGSLILGAPLWNTVGPAAAVGSVLGLTTLLTIPEMVPEARKEFSKEYAKEQVSVTGTLALLNDQAVFRPEDTKTTVPVKSYIL